VKDGKFVKVGTDAEVSRLHGDKTEVVDLRGNLVLPGLIDAHMHPDLVAENYFNINIDPEATTYEEFKVLVRDYLKKNPDAKWAFGGNLDFLENDNKPINMFGKPSNKSIIDEVVSDRPAFFWDAGVHAALVNSKAFELLGITRDTPNPPGGEYVKDKNGELTGVLREMAATVVYEEFLKDRLPEKEIAYRHMKPVFEYLNSLGVTSVCDAYVREWYLKAYNILDREGALNMRIAVYVSEPSDWIHDWMKDLSNKVIYNPKAYCTEKVNVLGVKFILDGSAGGRTAVLVDPYEGEDEYRGPWRMDPKMFQERFLKYDKMGLTVKAHCAADGAARLTLDTIERARKENGGKLRHSAAHCSLLHPQDLSRFAKLDAMAEFSPVFWYHTPAIEVMAPDLGEKRVNQLFPIRSVIDTGAHVSIGSDWPVTSPNPWPAIEAAVTRRAPGVTSGPAMNSAQAITLEEAVYLYTMGGAYEQYRENETGSIETGKYADFIVVNQNIFDIPIQKVHETKVLSTVVGGKAAYVSSEVQKIIDLGEISGQFSGGNPCQSGYAKRKKT
jgi:predicted amidohydrolase YtcJ